ncbi:hypothetical protein RSAG8_09220, partial [Rhizoctonia solani AG-8 WAC10335]
MLSRQTNTLLVQIVWISHERGDDTLPLNPSLRLCSRLMLHFLAQETRGPVFAVLVKSEESVPPGRGGSQSACQVARGWRPDAGASIVGLSRYVNISCRLVEGLRSARKDGWGLVSAMIQVYSRTLNKSKSLALNIP